MHGQSPYWGSLTFNLQFWVISIVIDSDRGHCYEHYDIVTSIVTSITMKIERMTCIRMFVYVINFELPEMAKK